MHNLPWDCTWQQLKDAFSPCGEIERADVVFDSRGRSRCVRCCTCCGLLRGRRCCTCRCQAAAAAAAAAAATAAAICCCCARCCRTSAACAGPARRRRGRCTPLPPLAACTAPACCPAPTATRRSLAPATSLAALPAPGRLPRSGFGIVRFPTKEAAEKAVNDMNNASIGGRVVSVRIDRFA